MKSYYFLPVSALLLLTSAAVFSQNPLQSGLLGLHTPAGQSGLNIEVTVSPTLGIALRSPETFTESTAVESDEKNIENDSTETVPNAIPTGSSSLLSPPASGVSGYSTSIGLRGGYTSGITLKHFVKSNAAIEVIVGTRYEGFSLTGLYELHSANAFGISQLTWEYGLGARVGSYRGSRFYGSGRGRCDGPNDRRCADYWGNRSLTAVGLVGIGGLEYKFDEIPFTISLDLIPVVYLNYWSNNFIDASLSVRYIIK